MNFDLSRLARRAAIMSMVDTAEQFPNTHYIHLTIYVFASPEDTQPLWDAPVEFVNEGSITLNINQHSIGMRQFNEDYLYLTARFNGVEREMFIPYNLIHGFAVLDSQKILMMAHNLSAENHPVPQINTNTAPQDTTDTTQAADNVVTAAFCQKKQVH